MALKWNTVRPEHVRTACDRIAAGKARTSVSGLVVWHHEQALPAKEVLRTAYRLANNLGADEDVKFSSGDATLRLLVALGFSAERIGSKRAPTSGDSSEAGDRR
jgi:hypothetical protein